MSVTQSLDEAAEQPRDEAPSIECRGLLKNSNSLEKTMTAFPERSASGSEKPAFPLSETVREPLATQPTQPDLLAQYGITPVPLTSYEWGGYRYSNAHDAIAAAQRGASK